MSVAAGWPDFVPGLLMFRCPRFGPHVEYQRPACNQVCMVQERFVKNFPVEHHGLDVNIPVGQTGGPDGKSFITGQADDGRGDAGAADGILGAARADRVESEHAEDIPCAHLSAIIVAAQPVWPVVVHGIYDLADALLCFPWFGCPVIKVSHMMAGFISVNIVPDKSRPCHVFCLTEIFIVEVHGEEGIEPADKFRFTTCHLYIIWYVVGHIERIVP